MQRRHLIRVVKVQFGKLRVFSLPPPFKSCNFVKMSDLSDLTGV